MTDHALNYDVDCARRSLEDVNEAFRKAHDRWVHGAEGDALIDAFKTTEAQAERLADICRDCALDAGWESGDEWEWVE